jgi:hypothetical protein
VRRHAARYGWALSDAYREEIRKLRALPSDLPAPALLWTVDDDIAYVRWVILCFKYIDGVASASTLAAGRTAPDHRRVGADCAVSGGGAAKHRRLARDFVALLRYVNGAPGA